MEPHGLSIRKNLPSSTLFVGEMFRDYRNEFSHTVADCPKCSPECRRCANCPTLSQTRRGDPAGGRGRFGADSVSLFAKGVDAYGQLLAGNVLVRDATDRTTPSLNRISIEMFSKIRSEMKKNGHFEDRKMIVNFACSPKKMDVGPVPNTPGMLL